VIKPNDKPWFNNNINEAIKLRNRYFRRFKSSSNIHSFLQYKNQIRVITNLITSAKENYEKNLCNSVGTSLKNPKLYWNTIKKLMGNKFTSTIPTMVDPLTQNICSTNVEKANLFLKTISSKLHRRNLTPNNRIPHFLNRCVHNFIHNYITSADILKLLKNCEAEKACGPDNISNKMLKLIAPNISPILAKLFNKIIDSGIFPNQWKHGTVSVIYKKGDKNDPNNYRPITLLCNISKLLERLIFNPLLQHLLSNNLIYN